jgi:hypothetical protein
MRPTAPSSGLGKILWEEEENETFGVFVGKDIAG